MFLRPRFCFRRTSTRAAIGRARGGGGVRGWGVFIGIKHLCSKDDSASPTAADAIRIYKLSRTTLGTGLTQ